MRKLTFATIGIIVTSGYLASAALPEGSSILIDFGVDSATTTVDSNLQHWNNVSDIRLNMTSSDLTKLLALDAGGNLIDSTGADSGVTFSAARVGDAQLVRIAGATVDFTGTLSANPVGTIYDATAFADGLFVRDNNNETPDLYQVTIGGLDDGLSYDFTFLSAFDGGNGNGNIFAALATGSTTGSSIADAGLADNASNTHSWFQLTDVTPSNGQVVINFYSDQNNNGRMNTMEISLADPITDPYALWAADKGAGAMDEDDDKDGLVNLVEYALGGNPTDEDDSGLLPTQVETVDGLRYVFRRRLDPAAAGLSYTVETSTSLASGEWTETGTVEISADPIDTEFVSVINSVDTTGKPALFIRLKIEAE